MHFLMRDKPEDWLDLEAHQIDEMITHLDKLPDFGVLRNEINELKNFLRILKDRKKPEYAEQIHLRAEKLYKTLDHVTETFKDLKKQAKAVEEADSYIRNNLLTIHIHDLRGRRQFISWNRKTLMTLGRETIEHSPTWLSRRQLGLQARGENHFKMTQLGMHDSYVVLHNEPKLIKEFDRMQFNTWYEILVMAPHGMERAFYFAVTEFDTKI